MLADEGEQLPIFLTSAMGVFEARRRTAGKGLLRHSALAVADKPLTPPRC